MKKGKFLGVFVHPLCVQNEGVQQVFDNLDAVGASAISISPLVARPAAPGKGRRFPDLARDGYNRMVARPVWGRRKLDLEFFLVYRPNLAVYEGGPYEPLVRSLPSDVDRDVPYTMISEAKARGMQVHMQIHPLVVPGLLEQDQPVCLDGSVPQPPQYVFAPCACPNNPSARSYGLALVEDTIRHFPSLEGLFIDFVEYGAYSLEDHFGCFCEHCERRAEEQGYEWESIKRDVTALWNWLHTLTPKEIARSHRMLGNPAELLEQLVHYPGFLQFLSFKARSVVGFYRQVRQILDRLGAEKVTLSARGWPPPWNRSSGMDYRSLAKVCTAVTPKLFTFAHSALPRWYGQALKAWNPDLSESEILDALVRWMGLPDDNEGRSFDDYCIPHPTQLHPVKVEAYRSRIAEIVDQVAGESCCYPFVHAYLPDSQWKQMVTMIRDSRADGMWLQMYAYLSDRKLKILREVWA